MRNFLCAVIYGLLISCLSIASAAPPETKQASVEEVFELSLTSLKGKMQQIEQRNHQLLSESEVFLNNIQSLTKELESLKQQRAYLLGEVTTQPSDSQNLKVQDIQNALLVVRQDIVQLENKIRSLDHQLQQLNKKHREWLNMMEASQEGPYRHQLSELKESLTMREKRNTDLKQVVLSLEKALEQGEAN